MATGQRDSILRYIRQVSGTGPVESDRTLLERFVRQGDGEAFATLVRRHGPMVCGVCRRILTCHQDADDAFQAVFLLLIRKAGSLRQPERLGPWLHGVAHRVALKARSVRQRRRREPLTDLSAPPVPDDLVWRELRPVLDDAVRSLATKYRVPFVLCYLQGMTHAEAARQLRCPPGTIATRLSRAREQLRARLVRRGITLSAGALAVALGDAAEGSVPAVLVGRVLRSFGPSPIISSQVAALAKGVCQAMLMEKMRIVFAAVLAAVAIGAVALGFRSGAAEPPLYENVVPPPAVPIAAPPADTEEAATVRTNNFEVTAPTGRIARLLADAAERQRKEKAVLWLGKELPAWPERCPIRVKIQATGTAGATTFAFDKGKVASRSMNVEGPLDGLLSSVLPHEITHTILADFFGAPLPRWADEGAAVLSEDEEEQQRYAGWMREIVAKERLIPLSRLLDLNKFPGDLMALFAEGHSLTRFLVERKDRKTFLAFIKRGSQDGWDKAVKEHYAFRDVAELERAWLDAVGKKKEPEQRVISQMPLARTGLPEEGPLPGVARLQPDGKGLVLEVTRTKVLYHAALIRSPDGKTSTPETLATVRNQQLKIAVPLSEVKAYDTDGKAIDPKQLPDLLKKERPILAGPHRSVFSDQLLRLVKEDTLLIVVKAVNLGENKEASPPTVIPSPEVRRP